MIPTIIVTNQPLQSIQSTFHIDPESISPNILLLTSEKSIGIDQVKQAISFSQTSPINSQKKYILIPQAESLTTVSQNTLLKSLEESPSYLQYVLCVPDTSHLLPTILSRSQIIHDQQTQTITIKPAVTDMINSLPQSTPAQKIDIALSQAKNRDNAIDFITQLTHHYRQSLQTNPTPQTLTILQNLHQTHLHLVQNTNPQLAVENFLLQTRF